MSFWQYQIYQENSFQQAVVRNLNEKNTQLQRQIESVVREANSEIALLNSKISQLERDLELERRKIHELQDEARERDKEYQKLKVSHDKLKRKALLVPNPSGQENGSHNIGGSVSDDQRAKQRNVLPNFSHGGNVSATIGGMEASGIQRTPMVNRSAFMPQGTWNGQQPQIGQTRNTGPRPFATANERAYQSGYSTADESANEVEDLLMDHQVKRAPVNHSGWNPHPGMRPNPQGIGSSSIAKSVVLTWRYVAFAAPTATRRTTGKFRPVNLTGR